MWRGFYKESKLFVDPHGFLQWFMFLLQLPFAWLKFKKYEAREK